MRWVRCLVLLLHGCGPTLSRDVGGGDATESSDTDGMTATATSTGSQMTASTSAADTSTTGGTTDDGATIDPVTGLDDTMGVCMWCEGPRIGPDDPVEEGYTAREVAGALDGLTIALSWNVDALDTILTIGVSPPVGPVHNIPGEECCDPCLFINVPCPGGLEFSTQVTIRTDDGLLAEVITATVDAHPAGELFDEHYGIRATIAGEKMAGTLPGQTLEGEPIEIATLHFALEHRPADGQWVTTVMLHDGNQLLGTGGP